MQMIDDPKILFERWFVNAIAKLRELQNADGGTAGLMIVLPLYERYIYIVQGNAKSKKRFYETMADDLDLKPSEAETFWKTFRHGFCHTGMPFERSKRGDALPKVSLSGSYSHRPELLTASNGQKVIRLDPWKFIDHVMDKYRNDSAFLTKRPTAPLLAIHVVAFSESSGITHGYSGFHDEQLTTHLRISPAQRSARRRSNFRCAVIRSIVVWRA